MTPDEVPAPDESGAAHQAPTSERVGQVIDRYTLIEPLGEGGMGTVWLAEQARPVKRRVALKVIKLGMDTREVVLRFEAERQALALMDHPGVAKVLDGGATESGRPYFVMELVDGVPITHYCDERRLDLRARLALFVRVCEAIQHAHHKGLIHRDIKPSNVLVAETSEGAAPKVIDFGVAKATSAELTAQTLQTELGQILGTPEYMAPEQSGVGAGDVDTRADVYSLGVLLYELLTGSKVFDTKRALAEGFAELLRQIREVEPPLPSTRVSHLAPDDATAVAATRASDSTTLSRRLRGDLDWVVMKAIEKDRARRYDTPSAMAEDVERYLANEPVEAAPPSRMYRLRKFAVRRKGTVAAITAIFLVLVAGVIGTGTGLARALDQKQRADLAADREKDARLLAEEKERLAVEAAERALAAGEKEAAARSDAERITDFMTEVLQSGNAVSGGHEDKTILEALDDALADLAAGRFADSPGLEAKVQDTIARIFLYNGRAAEAEALSAAALETIRGVGPDVDPQALVAALTNHGSVLRELGRHVEALPLFREALELQEAIAPGEDVEELTIRLHLATCLMELGEQDMAGQEFDGAVAMARRLPELEPREFALALQNSASYCITVGRYEEAESLAVEAEQLYREVLDGDDPAFALVLTTLGHALSNQGRLEEAAALIGESHEMNRRLYQGDNEFVALGLANLGAVHAMAGDLVDAERCLTESLEMYQRLYAGGHLDVARGHERLAQHYHDRQMFAAAEPHANLAVDLYRTLGDTRSIDYAVALFVRAECLRLSRRPLDAEPEYREALTLFRSRTGVVDGRFLACLNGAAVNAWMLGRLDESVAAFEELVPLNREYHGPHDPHTAQSVFNLGINLRDAGRVEESVPHLIEGFRYYGDPQTKPVLAKAVLDGFRKHDQVDAIVEFLPVVREVIGRNLPEDSPELARLLASHGQLLSEYERWADAEPLLRTALEVEARERPDEWRTAALRGDLGQALVRLGRLEEGEQELLAAEAGLVPDRGRGTRTRRSAQTKVLGLLVELCEGRGDADAAEVWRAKLAEVAGE